MNRQSCQSQSQCTVFFWGVCNLAIPQFSSLLLTHLSNTQSFNKSVLQSISPSVPNKKTPIHPSIDGQTGVSTHSSLTGLLCTILFNQFYTSFYKFVEVGTF